MDNVVACEACAGDESQILSQEARARKEGGDLLGYLIEAVLGPLNRVQFVDCDDDALDAHAADEQCVFFGLAPEAGFEVACAGVYDEDGEVSLAGPGDHVGDEIPVTRGIEDREAGVFRFKLVHSNIDGDAPVSLFGALI